MANLLTCKQCERPFEKQGPASHVENYCPDCWRRSQIAGTETVRGTIVGGDGVPYEFWTTDGTTQIAARYFESDGEAVEWFKREYPEAFKAGVEMRVRDI